MGEDANRARMEPREVDREGDVVPAPASPEGPPREAPSATSPASGAPQATPTAGEGSHGHSHGEHHHGHHHHHRRRKHRATPRSARLAWWHVLLVIVVGVLVTYLVIHLASNPGAPPPG